MGEFQSLSVSKMQFICTVDFPGRIKSVCGSFLLRHRSKRDTREANRDLGMGLLIKDYLKDTEVSSQGKYK